jgi:hypothetical protein
MRTGIVLAALLIAGCDGVSDLERYHVIVYGDAAIGCYEFQKTGDYSDSAMCRLKNQLELCLTDGLDCPSDMTTMDTLISSARRADER